MIEIARRITIKINNEIWRIIIYAKSQLEINLERAVSISETINKLILFLHEYYGLDINTFIQFIEEQEKK